MRAAYRACKMESRGIAILNFRALTDFVATIIVLTFHGHAVALACGWLASMLFWVTCCYLDVRRRCPEITFAFGPVSRDQFVSMMIDGLPVLAGATAGAFFLQGYPLIVNRVLGPATVVTLTAIRTASRTLLQMTGLVCAASSSELSRTYGSQDWEGYLRLLKVLVAVTLWTSVAAVVGLSLAGPWVIEKWTWGKVLVGHRIMLLFVLSVICQSCWNACGSILFSSNMHHAFNYAYLFLTLVGLGAANIAMHFLGFIGVPVTMVAVDGLMLWWSLYLCQKKLVFVPLRSLVGVLYPSFYLDKAGRLLRHLSGRTGSL
jgi:O-antigen/teichoic acid export membrane protein